MALIAATVIVGAGAATLAANPASAATGCRATYTVNQWPGGFTGNITLTNLGDALTSWNLTWTFGDAGQKITQSWNSKFTQSGANVTLTNEAWNGNLGTNASVNPGFNGSWTSANPTPTQFFLNGTLCTGSTSSSSSSSSSSSRSSSSSSRSSSSSSRSSSSSSRSSSSSSSSTTRSIVANPASLAVAVGSSGTFGVRLAAAPTANVTVSLTKSGASSISVTPTSFTFTPSNWNTAQNATVSVSASAATTDTATITAASSGYTSATVNVTVSSGSSPYKDAFLALYNKVKDPANGYFSPLGIPYHHVEELNVESVDYGHESDSEAFSYLLSLEAYYGRYTGNWTPFNNAWALIERYAIPPAADQQGMGSYNPSDPADYLAEAKFPDQYPTALSSSVPVGQDPISNELKSAYGTDTMYGMHWLMDPDNKFGFGRCGDGTTKPSYINTFQRGQQESTWETITQPSCENFAFGQKNNGGFLPLYQQGTPAQQWRYTDAPDADARAVQATYNALQWATAQGKASDVSSTLAKAAKMGDYLRYSMYDKYFKTMGCSSVNCPGGTGKNSSAFLINWYYAWGAGLNNAGWAWKIGGAGYHNAYQNPVAAYALSQVPQLAPKSATGQTDWATSLSRQLEFYQWLQSSEGAFAGGATNQWDGLYTTPPSGTPTFYNMWYDWQPVWHDPPSNRWFGYQAWPAQRIAEYYYITGDAKAKALLDKWVAWVLPNITTGTDGSFAIPSDLEWTGAPATWNPSSPAANTNLHVSISTTGADAGVAGALARTLIFYGAKANNTAAKDKAKALLDALLANEDSLGITTDEPRSDYNRFDDVYPTGTNKDGLYVPSNYNGVMPNGDQIKPGASFLSIRSFFKNLPGWDKVQAYLDGGPVPVFRYHRFWAQADIAMALGEYGQLIG